MKICPNRRGGVPNPFISSKPKKFRLVALAVPVAIFLLKSVSKNCSYHFKKTKRMQAPQPIPVFRPTYLTDGQEFQGSLIESPANIFYQKVNAATLERM